MTQESEQYICQYCNSGFISIRSLAHHLKNAKYCLSLQGKKTEKYKCIGGCEKSFATNSWLIQHQVTCFDFQINIIKCKYEIEFQLLKEQLTQKDDIVKEKDQTIKELAKKAIDRICINNKEINNIPISVQENLNSIIITKNVDTDDANYSTITLNNIVILSRPIDHYINATRLCQAGDKLFRDWMELDTTKEVVNDLSSDIGIPVSLLVESQYLDIWIHPDLSIHLSNWNSPKFTIQVSKWIRSLFNQESISIDIILLREKERELREKNQRIKKLENICISKQRRVEYPEHNVIYLLTTEDHIRRRIYIIGKAKNLTTRLSTYNKTCDHIVVHYRECKSEDDMDIVETLVLSKLKNYREQANRDRFILPDDKDDSFFVKTIDECIRFL